jgi:hypothetical protein
MSRKLVDTVCPICGTNTQIQERTWYYTCIGCGSGIHLVGIFWKEKTGGNWLEASEEEKKTAGDEFYQESKEKDWSNIVIEI